MRPHKIEFFEQFRERLSATQAYTPADLAQAVYNSEDPGWAVALTVLAHPRIARRARPYIELRRGFIDFDEMERAPDLSSHGERLLVAVASSLYNSATKVDLAALCACLEYSWLDYAVAGLLAFQHRAYHPCAVSAFVPPAEQSIAS